jgi:hypothetical protein
MTNLQPAFEREQQFAKKDENTSQESSLKDAERRREKSNTHDGGVETDQALETPIPNYPQGLRLTSIMAGILLSFFLVSLDSVGHHLLCFSHMS